MKTKPGWLIVILISSIQLAVLLVAVLMLFSWFSCETENTVRNQVCDDNQVIARHVINEAHAAGIGDVKSEAKDAYELSKIVSRVEMPNHGFICLVDSSNGMTICPQEGQTNFIGVELGKTTFRSLQETKENCEGEGTTLLEAISKSPNKRSVLGEIMVSDQPHFVSAEFIPELNSTLVVGQQRNHLISRVSSTMAYTKRVVFAATLFIGLACLGLFLSVFNRQQVKAKTVEQGLENKVSEREKELVQTQNAVIFGLAKLAESRDNDTGEHLDRIRSYVTILTADLATRLPEIDDAFVHNIALASSLHDIGKVGIPDSILLKPGRLSKEEREVMELHTLIGGECLDAIQGRLGNINVFMHTAKQIAYYHHERWDGKGYPHGLSENEIPLVARIVAVADVYDALTSKRPYKNPMTHIESKAIIMSGSGSHFDPEVVSAFMRHEDKFEAISRGQLSLTDEDVLSDFHLLCERAGNSTDQTLTSPR